MRYTHLLAIAFVLMMYGCDQPFEQQQSKDTVHTLAVPLVCLDTEIVDSILAAKARGEDGVAIVSAHLDAGRAMIVDDEDKVRLISTNKTSARIELISGKHIGVVCYVPTKWLKDQK